MIARMMARGTVPAMAPPNIAIPMLPPTSTPTTAPPAIPIAAPRSSYFLGFIFDVACLEGELRGSSVTGIPFASFARWYSDTPTGAARPGFRYGNTAQPDETVPYSTNPLRNELPCVPGAKPRPRLAAP